MYQLSASLLRCMQPGASYAPGSFSSCQGGGCVPKKRRVGVFLSVAEGAGLLVPRAQAGGGLRRTRPLLVYEGRVEQRVSSLPLDHDWLEFDDYQKQQIQKVTQIVLHYLWTRWPCSWKKVIEDINGRYEDHFQNRRVYDVVNVLMAMQDYGVLRIK